MAVKMIEVRHKGVDGTAIVPETALRHMADGWQVVSDDVELASDGTAVAPAADAPKKKTSSRKS